MLRTFPCICIVTGSKVLSVILSPSLHNDHVVKCVYVLHGVLAVLCTVLCCILCYTLWSLHYRHGFTVCSSTSAATTTYNTSLAIVLCDVVQPFAILA